MGECIWELSDGLPCGAPTEATNRWCPFHRARHIGGDGDSQRRLKNYAAATNRSFLDLSFVRFERVLTTDLDLGYGRPVKFVAATFNHCQFIGLQFKHGSTFDKATFENTFFKNCVFEGKAVSFNECVFNGDRPVFTHVSFLPKVELSFAGAIFHGATGTFDEVYCRTKKVDLGQCSISADRLLIMICDEVKHFIPHQLSINADQISFVDLRFESHFEYINNSKALGQAPIVLFSRINFSRLKSAVFINANLERARFTYSVLSKVDFINVRWPQKKNRLIVYDELSNVDDTESGDLLYTYSQLKKNYEENRAYEQAGDWHYREMEIRRRNLSAASGNKLWRWLRRNFLSLYPWYKLFSGYGESYGRSLSWIVVIWAAFAIVYNCINQALTWPPSVSLIQEGFALSAAVMTLQYKGLYSAGQLQCPQLIVLQILLTATVLPLFLLALRRRFKR